MPIDHRTRLPLSAAMATWLAALQLYISRQEGSGDVFSVQDSHRLLILTLTWIIFTHDATTPYFSVFFSGYIQMILASPALQTLSVIQNIVLLNQTPCSYNLPVGHTGYSSVGSAVQCCTQMIIYIMWNSAVQALCSGDKEEFRWGENMNVMSIVLSNLVISILSHI